MRHFIGGLLEGMAELTAIFAPTPNSYRRFAPYSWAGTTATWGIDNRSAGLRAIAGRQRHACGAPAGGRGCQPVPGRRGGARGRLGRRPAGVRAAAPALDGDVYALAGGAVPALPATLAEATDLLERSALAATGSATTLSSTVWRCGAGEVAAQAAAVTDWEIARYLEAL